MMHSIKRRTIVLLFIDIAFFILALCMNWMYILTILTVGQLILEIIIIYEKSGRIFCFSNIFLILSYILHMGNLVSVCLLQYENNYIVSLEKKALISSIQFFMLCHLFFTIGNVFTNKKSIRLKGINYNISLKELEQVGWISLCVGIIPRVYLDCRQISLQLNGDYVSALNTINKNGIIGILALFFYVGVTILMYTSANHLIRARVILISVTVWEIITMLSGSRIFAISLIAVLFYIYFLKVKSPKMKTMILFGVGAVGISVIMAIIAQVRMQGSFNINDIQNILRGDMINQNPIIAFLAEMGGTMKSLVYSIQDFPSYSNYAYGKSYIQTFISAIPFVGEKLVNENYLVFKYNFRSHRYLGGSWLGEAYYNFSWFGCIFCFFIGKCTYKIDFTLANGDNTNNIVKLFCLTFLFYFIRYIRDYFGGFAQPIQICLVLLVFIFIIRTFYKNKSY